MMHTCIGRKLLGRVQVTRASAAPGCRAQQQRRVHSGEESSSTNAGHGHGHRSNAPPPAKSKNSANKLERLSKVLQGAGVASRRGADALIAQNRVGIITSLSSQSGKRTLDADEVQPFTRIDIDKDIITVDGERIDLVQSFSRLDSKVYVALYKPKGYICSTTSNNGKESEWMQRKNSRTTRGTSNAKPVLDLVAPLIHELTQHYSSQYKSQNHYRSQEEAGVMHNIRLFTVGRLDVNTSGLLLITNDGDFSHRCMHPSSNIEREYLATVLKPSRRQLSALANGCMVDGVHVRPLEVHHEGRGDRSSLYITVGEGRYHEVRELVAAAGMTLKTLKRIRIGGLRLGTLNLREGQYKVLKDSEANDVFL